MHPPGWFFYNKRDARLRHIVQECPPGKWIDYQTGEIYEGGWHRIESGGIPVVMLVRNGAVIPHAALAQSTGDIDWTALDLIVFSDESGLADGKICMPADNVLHKITVEIMNGEYSTTPGPLDGRVVFTLIDYRNIKN